MNEEQVKDVRRVANHLSREAIVLAAEAIDLEQEANRVRDLAQDRADQAELLLASLEEAS